MSVIASRSTALHGSSIAIPHVRRINAAGLERQGELDDPVPLRKDVVHQITAASFATVSDAMH
jgi:hypothetical protein